MGNVLDLAKRAVTALEERPALGYHHIAAIILVLAYARVSIEQYLFPLDKFDYIAQYHVILFFYLAFFGGLFIIHAMMRHDVLKSANLLIKGFWIVLLPPIMDFYLFGRQKGYFYMFNLDLKGFLYHFPTLFITYTQRGGEHVYGLLIETYLVSLGSGLYVYLRTRRPGRALATTFIIYLFMILLAKGTSYLFTENSRYLVSNFVFNTIFIILTLAFLACILYVSDRRTLWVVINNVRPPQTLTFVLMGLIGAFLAMAPLYQVGVEGPPTPTMAPFLAKPIQFAPSTTTMKEPTNIVYMRVFSLVSGLLAILFIQQTSIVINDIYDREIDEETNPERPLVTGALTLPQYRVLGLFFCATSYAFIISNALAVSVYGLVLITACLVLLVAYSAPPLRLRRYVPNSLFIGMGAAICLLIGYFTQSPLPPPILVRRAVALTFLALSIGTNVKDLKDYESDRKHGVRTLFTLLGRERGKNVCLLLLTCAYLLPLVIIPAPGLRDAAMLILALSLAAWSFHFREELHPVFATFFLVLLYALARILGAF